MALSVLASAIYAVLRPRLPGAAPQISYDDLVHRLPALGPPNAGLQARDVRLDVALGELVTACRAKGLPAISAIVVRQDTQMPGEGYYGAAHPTTAHDTALRAIDWGNEFNAARAATYPAVL